MNLVVYPPAICTRMNKLCYPIDPSRRAEFLRQYNIDCIFPSSIKRDPDEQYRFICTQCYNYVHPRKGSKISWHFRHYIDSGCSGVNGGGGESSTHGAAKYKLRELLRTNHPISILGTSCEYCNRSDNGVTIEYDPEDTFHTEYVLSDGGRADVAVINNNVIKYIFEVMHKHKTKIPRKEPWFEISADAILEIDVTVKDCIILRDIKDYTKGHACRSCYDAREKYFTWKASYCERKDEIKLASEEHKIYNTMIEKFNNKSSPIEEGKNIIMGVEMPSLRNIFDSDNTGLLKRYTEKGGTLDPEHFQYCLATNKYGCAEIISKIIGTGNLRGFSFRQLTIIQDDDNILRSLYDLGIYMTESDLALAIKFKSTKCISYLKSL